MKKSIQLITVAILVAISSSISLHAQETSTASSAKMSDATPGNSQNQNSAGAVSTETIITVDPRVLVKFTYLFPGATNQKWVSIENAFVVWFLSNGRKTSASFTQKGKLNYSLMDCTLEQLPLNFRKAIQKDYNQYKLFNAVEIKAYDTFAWQAILENENGFVTLKFTSEGTEEIQQVKKTTN